MDIKKLKEYSVKFNNYNQGIDLFEDLNKLDKIIVEECRKKWLPEKQLQPVNLLRFLIAEQLIKGVKISNTLFEDIKTAISNRNISGYYIAPFELQNKLNSYKQSEKGMFPQWKNPFTVLYPFFYSSEIKSEIEGLLNNMGNDIIKKYDLANAKVHVVGFDGPQNYGASIVWGAIIPNQSPNVRTAYQLFYSVKNGDIIIGLYKGHRIEETTYDNLEATFDNWESAMKGIEPFINNWKNLNSKIDFGFENDERILRNRIEKCEMKNVIVFFNCIDKIVEDLEIKDEENIVFSSGSNQLSFHVGKRYCLVLKKDKFSFIAPYQLNLKGLQKTLFAEPDKAYYYKEANAEIVLENIEQIVSAVQFEIERDNSTKDKDYDNVAFRKAVFDKEFRKSVLKFEVNNDYWILKLDETHHDYNGLLESNIEYDWGIRSLKDNNPIVGDKVLLIDINTLNFYGYGIVTQNPNMKVYNGDYTFGRSKKADRINHPVIKIKIIECYGKELNHFKNLISELGFFNSHKLISEAFFNDILNHTQMNLVMENYNELNQIFFGPPGTGKTFHTINESIKIVDPEFYKVNQDNREELKKRFKLLLLNNDNENIGQIAFTTFHQSLSYEDFIEGIKPVKPEATDTFLKYDIQEGIFKRICRLAKDSLNAVDVKPDSLISLSQKEFDKASFYKMSLGNSQNDLENEIYDYCIKNNCIALGWGDGYDFTGKDEKNIKDFGNKNGLDRFSITAINQFKVYLKIGDYVIISNGNYYVRAIGKVVGEYEYREESPFTNNPSYNQFRNVEWVFTNKQISATDIYNKNLSQQTIYELNKSELKQDFFVKEKKVDLFKLPKNPKNYVLIIDEINRGNVSSIFGELITLIEKDKRAGKNEELSVILPYSKKEFKVPHNVFIIGTMNTADRSIESLDTALRRRFSFREMPPKPELIIQEGKLNNKLGKIDDIDVVEVLKVINDRIEKLIDKDHKIGHAYFLDIESKNELIQMFKNKVIPLLEEYFFGDFGKISLILGSSFISKSLKSGVTFAKNNDYEPTITSDLLERNIYEITNSENWDFKAIYQ